MGFCYITNKPESLHDRGFGEQVALGKAGEAEPGGVDGGLQT